MKLDLITALADHCDWYALLLAQCDLCHSLNTLRITAPPELWELVANNIGHITPCRLEVQRVELWLNDRQLFWWSIEWWLG
jgi:hypothetical protein